jgi:hypothetical protein
MRRRAAPTPGRPSSQPPLEQQQQLLQLLAMVLPMEQQWAPWVLVQGCAACLGGWMGGRLPKCRSRGAARGYCTGAASLAKQQACSSMNAAVMALAVMGTPAALARPWRR